MSAFDPIPLTSIPGFRFGHYTDQDGGTGCTAIVAPTGAVGGVDVRGAAPASRETDLLRPENTVDEVHAVILSGGLPSASRRRAGRPASSRSTASAWTSASPRGPHRVLELPVRPRVRPCRRPPVRSVAGILCGT